MKGKVLLLEDDESIRSMIAINLKRVGMYILEVGTGEEALDMVDRHNDIDIAVLDIMLPGIDGIQVCRKIRKDRPFTGIIMLTAKAQEKDKINALESGADDYVTKPFSVAEFMARMNSLIRRVKINIEGVQTGVIKQGKFEIDENSKKFYKDKIEIELTPTEFSIVKLFMKTPGKAYDRNDILTEVWGEYYFGELKIVDVNVRRLRKKIEDDPSIPRYIETVWGMGYRWKEV